MPPTVKASQIYRFFHIGDDEVFALRGVDITIEPGEFVAVTGPSGSGKSTLFACIAGLDDPDGGTVEIAGERISRRPESIRCSIRARSIGIVLQSGNLFPHLSAVGNVQLQQQLAGHSDPKRASDLLTILGLDHRLTALPGTLSGGEAARVALAVALAAEPSLLLCDEPTGEVDAATEQVVLETLQAQQRRGAAVLVATHSAALAGKADRVIRIADGELQ